MDDPIFVRFLFVLFFLFNVICCFSLVIRCLRACLHEGGGPQVGEVTCGGSPHLKCKRDHIKMRDYMDRWVTSPKQDTSPTWDPSPPCKQALRPYRKLPDYLPEGVNISDIVVRVSKSIRLLKGAENLKRIQDSTS